jgi:muramoyltetrapeptide carboxypeptidase
MYQEKTVINPVVSNPNFKEALECRTIKMVAPASGTDPEKIQTLRNLAEYNIQIPEDLMEDAVAFHSNSDQKRFKFLKAALYDKSKKTIIWTLRGGYGATRLIDKLESLPPPKQEKIFIGFSDVTALHLFLSERWGWKTIHGSGMSEWTMTHKDPQNLQKIVDIIDNRVSSTSINHLKPFNKYAQKIQKITGRLTGGNLAIVETSLGTDWQIKTQGKIVFLEDTSEKGYKIDRTLHHLKQAGVFDKAKAIVLGDFVDPKDEHVNLALERFANEVQIPVFKTDQFGHGKTNHPLIYNAKSEIIPAGESFELKMHITRD